MEYECFICNEEEYSPRTIVMINGCPETLCIECALCYFCQNYGSTNEEVEGLLDFWLDFD